MLDSETRRKVDAVRSDGKFAATFPYSLAFSLRESSNGGRVTSVAWPACVHSRAADVGLAVPASYTPVRWRIPPNYGARDDVLAGR